MAHVTHENNFIKPIPVEAGSGFVLSTPMAKQKSNGVLVVSSQVSNAYPLKPGGPRSEGPKVRATECL